MSLHPEPLRLGYQMYQSGRDVGRGAAGTSDASVITLEAGFAAMPATREVVNKRHVFTADCHALYLSASIKST